MTKRSSSRNEEISSSFLQPPVQLIRRMSSCCPECPFDRGSTIKKSYSLSPEVLRMKKLKSKSKSAVQISSENSINNDKVLGNFKERKTVKTSLLSRIRKTFERPKTEEKTSREKAKKTQIDLTSAVNFSLDDSSDKLEKELKEIKLKESDRMLKKEYYCGENEICDGNLVNRAFSKWRNNSLKKKSKIVEQPKKMKLMRKEWSKNYAKMCHRAIELDLAITTAERHDLTVKPITRVLDQLELEQTKANCKKTLFEQQIQKGSYYSISSINSEEAEEDFTLYLQRTPNHEDGRKKMRRRYSHDASFDGDMGKMMAANMGRRGGK